MVGWGLVAAAVLCLLVGAAMALLLGPDDRIRSAPQALGTDASIVVTAPGALALSGPTVRIEASLPDDRPVFVGLGNAVDVSDYTDGVAALVVDEIDVPLDVGTEDVDGEPALVADPASLDWWLASESGDGTAAVSAELPSTPAQLVVAAVDGGDLEGLEVVAAYELDGGFGIGLGLIGLSVGLALFGWIALRRRAAEWDDWDDDEVDEDETDGGGDDNDDEAGDDEARDDEAGDDEAGDDEAGDDEAGDDEAGDDEAGDDEAGDDEAGDDEAGDDETERRRDQRRRDQRRRDQRRRDERRRGRWRRDR